MRRVSSNFRQLTARLSRAIAAVAVVSVFALPLRADSVRLVNGDMLKGHVESLNEQQLVIRSENFGEMKIPRHRVQTIMFGDKPLPTAASKQPAAAGVGQQPMPAIQNPQSQQQLNRMMQQALGGDGGTRDLRQSIESTRKGLQDLKKDIGNESSAQAIDSYIKMFELFGNIIPPTQAQPQQPSEQE